MRGRRDINKFNQRLSFPVLFFFPGGSADTVSKFAFDTGLNIRPHIKTPHAIYVYVD